jgi:hypothetical protein
VTPTHAAKKVWPLRRGTVPSAGLDLFAIGMERFERAIDEELDGVTAGRATFKAVRGEYGAGKTFFARWLAEQAKRRGMATAEVQISETETLQRVRSDVRDKGLNALRQLADDVDAGRFPGLYLLITGARSGLPSAIPSGSSRNSARACASSVSPPT